MYTHIHAIIYNYIVSYQSKRASILLYKMGIMILQMVQPAFAISFLQFTICRQSPEKKIDANAVKFDNACVVGFFHLFSVRLYSAMASSYFRDSRSTALPLPSIAVPMPLWSSTM